MYVAYTDGSCKANNEGGYASIILKNNNLVTALYEGFTDTTNNRQEALAVLKTLEYFKDPTDLTVISDSQYVVNTIEKKWLFKWIEENDLSKSNLDIWFKIADLLKYHNVTVKWVKGHNKDKWNEEADLFATHAATCLNKKKDIWLSN